jgi:hypothetical protein
MWQCMPQQLEAKKYVAVVTDNLCALLVTLSVNFVLHCQECITEMSTDVCTVQQQQK